MGLSVLAGWCLEIALLKNVFPGLETMKANTALSFIFSGVSLWVLQTPQQIPHKIRMAQVLALLVAALALATLSQDVFGWNLGIDQLIFQDRHTLGRGTPGRMSPATAFSFLLVSGSLFWLRQAAG
jgi:hypothetical protein